jgi:hypothetical protein
MSLVRVLGERLTITWVLILVGTFAFDTARYAFDVWRYDIPYHSASLIHGQLFGVHSFTGWAIVGAGGSLLLAWVLTAPGSQPRWQRIAAWVLVACAGLAFVGSLYEWYWSNQHRVRYDLAAVIQNVAVFTAALVATLWLALGKLSPMPARPRLRWLMVAAAFAGSVVIGGPTIAETWREYRPQTLPNFTIELVAARPVIAKVDGEVVTTEHGRFVLDRSDTLRFTRGHVRRVRRRDGGVSIRTSGWVAGAVRERSVRRLGRHDAIFVNGRLISVPVYSGFLIDGRLFISEGEGRDGGELYRALTTAPQ